MTNQPTPVILNDEALAEIEEHARKAPNGAEGWRVPALCQTVRALRTTIERLGDVGLRNAQLVDTIRAWSKCPDGCPLDEHINNITTQNTALREQLAENARRHFDDARSLEQQRDKLEQERNSLRGQLVGLNTRLAQVEKERDDWKKFAEECKEGIRASHRVLDELGVPREDAWLQETDGKNYGIEEVVEYPVHERIKMLPPFAATRMRERCVRELQERLRDPSLKFDNDGFRAVVIDWTNMLIRRLESLTLDGEKEQ